MQLIWIQQLLVSFVSIPRISSPTNPFLFFFSFLLIPPSELSLLLYIDLHTHKCTFTIAICSAYQSILYTCILMSFDQMLFHTIHVYTFVCMIFLLYIYSYLYIDYLKFQMKKNLHGIRKLFCLFVLIKQRTMGGGGVFGEKRNFFF